MDAIRLIETKRDGRENSPEELQALAAGAADGSIPDYQVAAWLMAATLRGLSPRETADLTLALAESGERLDLAGLPKPWFDKHSTGGVGDKTTLVLLPILAACGLTVAKMSGRGLGITGGTVDKLESVPGFRTNLSPEEMKRQAARIGLALTGQTPRLVPADRALYALRDVTGTVGSIPLITASILSKKIAGGAETVLIDVKCGSGAFMRTDAEARALADSLASVGSLVGLRVRTVVSDMDQPLGATVGNALEVKEAIAVLSGAPPSALRADPARETEGGVGGVDSPVGRFRGLCLELAGAALEASGRGDRSVAEAALASGAALAKAKAWFAAQGGDPRVFADDSWCEAPVRVRLPARRPGWVKRIDAGLVGEAALALGAGRRVKSDVVDPSVGIVVLRGVGAPCQAGDPIIEVHAARPDDAESALATLGSAFELVDDPVPQAPVVLAQA